MLLSLISIIIVAVAAILWLRSLPSEQTSSSNLISGSSQNCNACPMLCGQQGVGIVNMSRWVRNWRVACSAAVAAAKLDGREFKTKRDIQYATLQKIKRKVSKLHTRTHVHNSFKRRVLEALTAWNDPVHKQQRLLNFGQGKHRKGWSKKRPFHHCEAFRQIEREHMAPWRVARDYGYSIPYSTLPTHERTRKNGLKLFAEALQEKLGIKNASGYAVNLVERAEYPCF